MMTDSGLKSLKLSGSARTSGGQYDTVHGSGSIRIDGDVTCDDFHMSGSSRIEGNLITKTLHVSGSSHCKGSIRADEGHFSGSTHIDGNLKPSRDLKASGSLRVTGDIIGESFHGSGSLHVSHEISLEKFRWAGLVECPGLVSADMVQLQLAGSSAIGEIAGSHITINSGAGMSWSWPVNLFSSSKAKLVVGEVSGDIVEIGYTEAHLVRGDRVIVGPHCHVERIEYRDTLDIDSTSWVGEKTQVNHE